MNETAPKLVDNRRARKRHRVKKKASRFLALLLFLTGLILIIFRHDIDYYSIKLRVAALMHGGPAAGELVEIPLSFDMSGKTACGVNRENLIRLSQSRLAVYRKDGTTSLDETVALGNPNIVSSGSRFIAFDRGGKDMLVCSGTSVVERFTAGRPIIDADIGDGGWYAVAEEDPEFRAVVTLYNSYGKAVYVWKLASSYLSAVRVDGSGRMIVAGFDVTDGGLNSTVTVLERTKEEPVVKIELPDELVVSMRAEGGTLTVVTDRRVASFDEKTGEQTAVYEPADGVLLGVSMDPTGNTALLLGRYEVGAGSALVMLDSRLSETGVADTAREVRYLSMDSGKTAIIYDGGGAVYNQAGGLVTETLLSGVKAVLVTHSGRVIFVQTDKMTTTD
ncbi:hypothetical protein SDC9_65803 [bioreactor metagenome]|uniref:Uncharacterized protein n=1 Tax=bioreactor metagenome TaxID=1076179 RepID=A0A644XT44_9ZZZZ